MPRGQWASAAPGRGSFLPEDEQVEPLCPCSPTTRARDAAEKLYEIFGTDLGPSDGPDRSIA